MENQTTLWREGASGITKRQIHALSSANATLEKTWFATFLNAFLQFPARRNTQFSATQRRPTKLNEESVSATPNPSSASDPIAVSSFLIEMNSQKIHCAIGFPL